MPRDLAARPRDDVDPGPANRLPSARDRSLFVAAAVSGHAS
jgi:hypothetical protein